MTTPNLANITTITPLTFTWSGDRTSNSYVSGVPNGIFQNPANSNSVFKINAIIVNEFNTSYVPSFTQPIIEPAGGTLSVIVNPTYYLNLSLYNAAQTTSYIIYRNTFQGSVIALSKETPIYLNENNTIAATVVNANQQSLVVPFSIVISYEAIS